MTTRDWPVLPHDAIVEREANCWTVSGDLPNAPLGRQMVIVRRSEGGLLIHNPIALGHDEMARIDAWGPVETLLVPSALHRIDCERFGARYPEAQVICPTGAAKAVGKKVRVDGSFDDLPSDADISFQELRGTKKREGVLCIRSGSRATLVFNDVFFNQPHLPGFGGLFFRMLGSTGGPRVTRTARLLVVDERRALGDHLAELAGIEGLHRIVPGHGEIIEHDAAAILARVAATL